MAKFIDPWGASLPEDYEKLVRDFGLERFKPELFPNPNRLMRRGIVFAGRELEVIAKCIKEKKPFYALTGIMPSADKIHLGNKMVIEQMRYFQEHGAKTYVLVADLEAAATRNIPLEAAKKRALEFHIPVFIALGLDPKKTVFYFQSENKEVMHFAYEAAKRITLNEFKAIYGVADPSRILSALTQAGDILFPQFGKKENRMPGVIPVGPDQDPHIRLARDIVRRMENNYKYLNLWAPSSIYHKFTPSLQGDLKMSKSKPESCIDLPDDVAVIKKKLMSALTGGRNTIEEQRRKGGVPEKCMVFEFYKHHLIEDDGKLNGVFSLCRSGQLVCGDDKKDACGLMEQFMKDFTKRVERAKKNINKLKFIHFSEKR